MSLQLSDLIHPDQLADSSYWEKWRLCFEGGQDFITKYLVKFSTREDNTDFARRRSISYNPAHAKAAVIDVKNAIHNRLNEVLRAGGPASYLRAMAGLDGGVDNTNSTMDSFIATKILPELLSMRRVGVFVDKPDIASMSSLRDTRTKKPYLYTYAVEDIMSWSINSENILTNILLRDINYTIDETTQLVSGYRNGYRLLTLTENGVTVKLYTDKSELETEILLNLRQIPFVMFELSQSLLTDIADYQIAMMNMASSDTNYALNSNYPFYTEQFDPKAALAALMKTGAQPTESSEQGTAALHGRAGNNTIKVGVTHGRRYPIGTERPGFINPSAEPLRASMEKQDIMKEEIRQLLNLSLSNLAPRRASKESKEIDERGKEAGLAIIAFELEAGEREIAKIWANYEGSSAEIIVNYPQQYSLKSDSDRRTEAKEKLELLSQIPSLKFQKVVCKQVATLLLGTQVSMDELEVIYKEIDSAKVINIKPEVIVADHEAGLVSTKTASEARLYPEGDAEQAAKDHAERLARIAESQSAGLASQARGTDNSDSQGGKDEKKISQRADISAGGTPSVRGEGK
jgi:hypothetical protein